jgi:hypothetical protein
MYHEVMRQGLLACSVLLMAACGNDGPTAVPSPAPSPDISVACQPAGFSAGAGCATSVCTVASRNGFAGAVTLSCAAPPGFTCGFGPNPLSLNANGSAQAGFTVAADLTVPARVHSVDVVATSGSVRRTSAVMIQTGAVPPPRPVSSRSMMVAGCAGYAGFGPSGLQSFAPAIAGAWIQRYAGFCTQTDTRTDGRFDLEVPQRCYREGEPVYLTAGGMGTCFTIPFATGTTSHAVLIGRRECPGP